ncbi:MAG: SH3 domain-containing protein [Lachnospiraceae bacterium]|nr:SH3 domain-containing protein [Lachnospiraceae bacterium]
MNKRKGKTLVLIGFYLVVGFMLLYYSVSGNMAAVPTSLFSTASLGGDFNELEQKKPEQESAISKTEEKEEKEKETDVNQAASSDKKDSEGSQVETKPAEEEKQYSFITSNRYTILYVRREPSMQGEIIGRLAPGTTGDVIELGEEWSLITDGTVTGYSFNGYLNIIEKE